VRGRILTEKNWRNNTVQRTIGFANYSFRERISGPSMNYAKTTFGFVFNHHKDLGLSFAIVDDTLNNMQPISITDTLEDNESSSDMVSTDTEDVHKPNMVFGKIIPIGLSAGNKHFDLNTSSEEFIVACKCITNRKKEGSGKQIILVWDLGHLEMHCFDGQLCCIPRLCMTELLPGCGYVIIKQKGGWLLAFQWTDYIEERTGESVHEYLLYDLRHGRLAASFAASSKADVVIGKATPGNVQIYYGYGTSIPNATDVHVTRKAKSYQYHWRMFDIKVGPDISSCIADTSWYRRMPTAKAMRKTQEKHSMIEACVKEQGYWCEAGYLLKTISGNEGISQLRIIDPEIVPRHLVDDLFLISYGCPRKYYQGIFLVHSVSQQRFIW
jgi:hypothetical protein